MDIVEGMKVQWIVNDSWNHPKQLTIIVRYHYEAFIKKSAGIA